MILTLLPGLFFHIVPATNTSDSEESSSRAKCYKVRKMSSMNLTEMKVFVLRLKMNMAPEGDSFPQPENAQTNYRLWQICFRQPPNKGRA